MEDEMKKLVTLTAMMMFTTAGAFAADKTWTGTISDSKCGAKHTMAKMTDRECTEACVKGGSKYVFASEGKVYAIANQDDKDLATHAGHTVMLTGEMKGDSITVWKIEMPAKGGAKK
jgi:hypothetical protein